MKFTKNLKQSKKSQAETKACDNFKHDKETIVILLKQISHLMNEAVALLKLPAESSNVS